MNNFIKRISRILVSAILCGWGASYFISCQKADPSPYSTPEAGVTHAITPTYTITPPAPDTTASFKASVNSGSVMSFTPSKSTSGSKTTLKGATASYTITITFPSSTGPGSNYTMGFGGPGITADVLNGSDTYVVTSQYGGGFLTVDSISSKGKYYGSFSFSGLDTIHNVFMDVSQGSFYHL